MREITNLSSEVSEKPRSGDVRHFPLVHNVLRGRSWEHIAHPGHTVNEKRECSLVITLWGSLVLSLGCEGNLLSI